MKTNLGTLFILIVATSLTACHNNPSSSSQANTNDSSSISTTNDVTKTTATDTAQVMASTPAIADSTFLDKAYNIGVFEIKIAKLALQKSQDSNVKGLANMMIGDHTAMGKDVTALMKQKNYDIPAALPADLKGKLNELNKLTGKDFDKKYVEINVNGHKEALDMFKSVSNSSPDADVKKLATDALPKLQMHEEHALRVQGQLNS